jgi:tRNA U34 5-methylaminomethyl-2-thiouridine-forming methyltransferase MnmC
MSEELESHVLIEKTADGSLTVLDTRTGSTYHSRHGARAESMHVFIQNGLNRRLEQRPRQLRILEMGLGTGLNVLLTSIAVADTEVAIDYHALEAFPLPERVWQAIVAYETAHQGMFRAIHEAPWDEAAAIGRLSLTKHHLPLERFTDSKTFDLIYYDAFEPATQPELWTEDVFHRLYALTSAGGVLVTYCAKGSVRRAMQAAGFVVERLPGPPFKREMLRAARI